MLLTIALRKEVPDVETAQALYELVKNRLADKPDVTVNGQVTETLELNGQT